jgi:hypothetical protein
MHTVSLSSLTPTWAARLVAACDASGVHRVGTSGALASGAWCAAEAAQSGVARARLPVPIQCPRVDEAYRACAGLRTDGFPRGDAPACAGVSGTLWASEGEGDSGGAAFPPHAASIQGPPWEQRRHTPRPAALVVATRVTGDSLAPITAPDYTTPFGPPVWQVAGRPHAFRAEQAARHPPVQLVSWYRREAGDSFTMAAHAARGTSVPPLAVVTPRTGWWASTAERAGGMGAGLAALHAAGPWQRAGHLTRAVRAWATCGHELGHLGWQDLIHRHRPLLTGAHSWLHLGANLGGAGTLTLRVRAVAGVEAQRLRDLLVAAGYPAQPILVEPGSTMSGAGHDLMHFGAKVLSLAGSNRPFHAARDRWPATVNAPGIASITRAVARWITLQAG